jgi:D-glycero-D-manno-heptose 1,7-bisphosphate phosphatase
MKTVIMAGGKGTRLASVTGDEIPKPMVPVLGKPLLEYQIQCLVQNRLNDVIISLGHLGAVIENHFGDGSAFGCKITYHKETEALGTAGALFCIMDDLDETFLLLNGDILFDMDLSAMIAFHQLKAKALANAVSIAVHPNSHPYDSALIDYAEDGKITSWLNKEDRNAGSVFYRNCVNAGVHIISRAALRSVRNTNKKVDLDRDVLKPLAGSGVVFAYRTAEYIKDAGTVERYNEVSADLQSGLPALKNSRKKQRAVFLDRDGTINRANGFITDALDLTLEDGAARAIARLNRGNWLVIVITNQPVIARGEASLEDLARIHRKMEEDLGREGAYLDDIFFCPHHPEGGFTGERSEYKIDCDCRKPKPGLILEAAKKYNIDTASSWMAGDSERDILAGRAALCKTALLAAGTGDTFGAARVFPTLLAFAEFLVP